EINARYAAETSGGSASDIFLLLHRPRLWNPQEGAWMGRERKRGKLAELNALIRGAPGAAERFSLIVGDASLLRGVRYVITLDTDTQLPHGAAREMVATMAHPLKDRKSTRLYSSHVKISYA